MALQFGIEIECYFPYAKGRSYGLQSSSAGGRNNQYDFMHEAMTVYGEQLASEGKPEWKSGIFQNATLMTGLTHRSVSTYGHAVFGEVDENGEPLIKGWIIASDVSVADDRRVAASDGGYTLEIVSPILYGSKGLQQVNDLLRFLVKIGIKVNDTCGQHVHFDVWGRSWFTKNKFKAFTVNANEYYHHFWETITHCLPRKRRNTHWCQRNAHDDWSPYFLNTSNSEIFKGLVYRKTFMGGQYRTTEYVPSGTIRDITGGLTDEVWRYKTINWTTSTWRNGTMEYRQGMATLSPLHTIQWIRFLHKMYTMSYAPEWQRGGRFYEQHGNWRERADSIDQLCDSMAMKPSTRRYWKARWEWYTMSFQARKDWSINNGISSRQKSADIVAKGRRKWFVIHNANNY